LLKNKVGKRGIFSEGKKLSSNHHVYHAFHHVLTIKLPPQNAHFPQNPLQKRQFPSQKKICKEAPQKVVLVHGFDGNAFRNS
jgi:hypothetical protein